MKLSYFKTSFASRPITKLKINGFAVDSWFILRDTTDMPSEAGNLETILFGSARAKPLAQDLFIKAIDKTASSVSAIKMETRIALIIDKILSDTDPNIAPFANNYHDFLAMFRDSMREGSTGSLALFDQKVAQGIYLASLNEENSRETLNIINQLMQVGLDLSKTDYAKVFGLQLRGRLIGARAHAAEMKLLKDNKYRPVVPATDNPVECGLWDKLCGIDFAALSPNGTTIFLIDSSAENIVNAELNRGGSATFSKEAARVFEPTKGKYNPELVQQVVRQIATLLKLPTEFPSRQLVVSFPTHSLVESGLATIEKDIANQILGELALFKGRIYAEIS